MVGTKRGKRGKKPGGRGARASISNGSDMTRPAASISSKVTRSFSAASTSTRQRGSKGMPSTSSRASTTVPQSPFMLSRLSASSGTGSAQSGCLGLTLKLTVARDTFDA